MTERFVVQRIEDRHGLANVHCDRPGRMRLDRQIALRRPHRRIRLGEQVEAGQLRRRPQEFRRQPQSPDENVPSGVDDRRSASR